MKYETPAVIRIQKARTTLLLDHPFFGSLLFRLKGRENRSIATMATDGLSLYFNPDFVDTLNSATLAGVLAHEVMHPALQHHVRRSGRDLRRWNEACDYAINPLLLDAGLSLPDGVLVDHRFRGMSAEQIYNMREGEAQPQSGSPDSASDGAGAGAGETPEPQADSDEPIAPVTEGGIGQVLDAPLPEDGTPNVEEQAREWSVAVNQAVTLSKQAGKVPAGLARTLEGAAEAAVDWRELLRRLWSDTIPADASWMRPNRRHIWVGLLGDLDIECSDRTLEIERMVSSAPSLADISNLRKQALGLLCHEVFVPQSYQFGGEAQVDWYEIQAAFDGQPRKIYIFCMRSMASGAAFHRAYPHATQQAFLEAHELAFAWFGGVFRTLRFDNLSSAVKKILRGHQREETTRFIAFRSHWGFTAEFCTPGEGHEKGGVEGEGGQFRRNHLVPVPKVHDLEGLNRLLECGLLEEQNRIIAGRGLSIGASMLAEREHLLPLAAEGFDLAALHFPQVNQSGCVRVLTNFYSTPLPVGTTVEVKVYSAYVEIWHAGRSVARHERCYQRQQKVLELEHYLDTLEKKPGALAGSTALEQCRAQGRWPRSYDRFWEMATERIGRAAATRMMIDVLQLERRQGASHVRPALEQALAMGCANLGAIRYLLSVDCGQNNTLTPEVEADALRRYDRPLPSMEAYEQLRPNWPLATEVVQ